MYSIIIFIPINKNVIASYLSHFLVEEYFDSIPLIWKKKF